MTYQGRVKGKSEGLGWKGEQKLGGNLSHLGRVYSKGYSFLNRGNSRGEEGMSKDKSHRSHTTLCLEIPSRPWKSIIAKENPPLELL